MPCSIAKATSWLCTTAQALEQCDRTGSRYDLPAWPMGLLYNSASEVKAEMIWQAGRWYCCVLRT
jgi:hypothetical protein